MSISTLIARIIPPSRSSREEQCTTRRREGDAFSLLLSVQRDLWATMRRSLHHRLLAYREQNSQLLHALYFPLFSIQNIIHTNRRRRQCFSLEKTKGLDATTKRSDSSRCWAAFQTSKRCDDLISDRGCCAGCVRFFLHSIEFLLRQTHLFFHGQLLRGFLSCPFTSCLQRIFQTEEHRTEFS